MSAVWISAGWVAAACGGGTPILQSPHALPQGRVEAGGGVSSQISLGTSRQQIDAAREIDGAGVNRELSSEYLRGAFQSAQVAPGVAPWVGASVGLGSGNDGGLTYTGRSLRLGFRHVFDWDRYGLSAGLGVSSIATRSGSAAISDTSSEGLTGGVDWSARGLGADLPVVFGWAARADVVALWVGARVGFESLYGELPFASGGLESEAEADLQRWYGGGLLGFSAGIEPIWVRVEFDASFSRGRGEATLPWADSEQERVSERVSALALTPAGAIFVRF